MDTSTPVGLSAKELLTPAEVEQVYGLKATTLRQWRYEGHGPRYVKTMPGRSGLVMYRRRDIDTWLDDRTVQPAAAL
jgi:predicted DNA-binding transcriptional regulator AlpA